MNTPIVDFVKDYANADFSRFHMPGHKGKPFLGCETLDITEINGADVLYMSEGIIKESEENASSLFDTAKTYYSTEGSSLAIRAMIASLTMASIGKPHKPLILAARNVHKAFIYACATLDIDVSWIYPKEFTHLCSCIISAADVEEAICTSVRKPDAVYITSPDYLGNIADIAAISNICEKHGILLLVDNAHGAYLHFLEQSLHPIKLGAHMCCDSAHKTLPVLTGGAYLHISKACPAEYILNAQRALRIYASTSPSYLIMQSLDMCNKYLSDNYRHKLQNTINKITAIKRELLSIGFAVRETEPLKIVINIEKSGLCSQSFTALLTEHKISPEMCDDTFAVFMVTPENSDQDLSKLLRFFKNIVVPGTHRGNYALTSPTPIKHTAKLSIRNAIFTEHVTLPILESIGMICASPVVSCPPAVPVVISGEVITEQDVQIMKKYHIEYIDVVSDK